MKFKTIQDFITQTILVSTAIGALYAGYATVLMPEVEAKILKMSYSKKDGLRLERLIKEMRAEFSKDLDMMHNDMKTDLREVRDDVKKILSKP